METFFDPLIDFTSAAPNTEEVWCLLLLVIPLVQVIYILETYINLEIL